MITNPLKLLKRKKTPKVEVTKTDAKVATNPKKEVYTPPKDKTMTDKKGNIVTNDSPKNYILNKNKSWNIEGMPNKYTEAQIDYLTGTPVRGGKSNGSGGATYRTAVNTPGMLPPTPQQQEVKRMIGLGADYAGIKGAEQMQQQQESYELAQGQNIPTGTFKDDNLAFGAENLISPLMGDVSEMGITQAIQSKQALSNPEGEMIQRLGLTDMDMKVLESGDADVSLGNQIIETIPFIKGKVSKYLDTGATGVKKIDDSIGVIKNNNELIKFHSGELNNPMTPPYMRNVHLEALRKAQNNILWEESRIKLITIQTPSLQANPKAVQAMQGDIDLYLKNNQVILRQAGITD